MRKEENENNGSKEKSDRSLTSKKAGPKTKKEERETIWLG